MAQTQPAKVRDVQSAAAHDVAQRIAAGIAIGRGIRHLAHTHAVQNYPDNSLEHQS